MTLGTVKPDGERGSRARRLLDRVVGIPLVAVFGHLRRKRSEVPTRPKTIGVLKTAGIGDTTLLSGPLLDLRSTFPDAVIVLFSGGSNMSVASLLEGATEVIKVPIKNIFDARRVIKQYRFDLFLDFGPWPRLNSILTHFADARLKVGFKTPG